MNKSRVLTPRHAAGRRSFLLSAALGPAGALLAAGRAEAAEWGPIEKANVKIVNDFCAAISMPHTLVRSVEDFPAALQAALAAEGPQLVEVDMCAIGPFAESFSGPPAGAAGNKV